MKRLVALAILSAILAICAGIALQPFFLSLKASPPEAMNSSLAVQASTTESPTQSPATATPPPATSSPTDTPAIVTPESGETGLEVKTQAVPTVAPVAYAYGTNYFPANINPLTGLPVEDPGLLERRPIAIKVTNFPRSVRPQWGLSLADHVYEYYIGDQLSRFIGIFYSRDASRVGPIRSARLFDEHLVRMYDSIFLFAWADDKVLDILLVPDLIPRFILERNDIQTCPPLCRIGPKGAYNTLYTDTQQIGPYLEQRGSDNQRQDLNGLRFEVEIPKSGHAAQRLSIQYTRVSYHYWEYDQQSGRYLRFQENSDQKGDQRTYTPLTDSLTGVQLFADNLVVLRVPHEIFYKSSSTEIIDQPITGEGSGYALRNGQLYPIRWVHPQDADLFNLYLPNGRAYPLKPGNVWFEVVGESSLFGSLQEGAWDIEFQMP